MKPGKLNWEDLKELIDENRGFQREEVVLHSGIGEDCAVINFGDYDCVISTDPITGAGKNIGKLAVNINCNDIASSGVEPIGIMVTILAPEGTTLEEIKALMQEIGEEAARLNIEVMGGHTEVTSAVNKMIVSCTIIGKGKAGTSVATSGAKVGDDIVVTKFMALEGTSIIVNDHEQKVQEFLTEAEIIEAKGFTDYLSVLEEGKLAGELGVNSMHDITEGGLLGALWEMAKASQVGFRVFEEKIPIKEVTKKICSSFNLDPLKLISSGSMLITMQQGERLVKALQQKGINAAVIGKITEGSGILVKEGVEQEVPPPQRDELFNL
ncbi:AIR synthase family protein [Clostridium thermarum]|uniref:AIR synthase family protein n=1 Tax=Clostridium thermarum TaxID=1716543 RepID=UPI0011203F3F|nr:AIR synthase family protein [Clostridium thermarum]